MTKKSELSRIKRFRDFFLKYLEQKNAMQEHNLDLVDSYIAHFKIKNDCLRDIEKRGNQIPYISREGNTSLKDNPQVAMLRAEELHMSKIISDLGLRLADLKAVDEDEEL